jgi:hypothetical protein
MTPNTEIFERAINLIGKPLNNEALQEFINVHGFKQPKRTEISGKSSERSFWVENKKLKVNLLFNIDPENPIYNTFSGKRKGMWQPILQQVTFSNPKFEYPFGLKIGLTHQETTKIMGDFTFKSSDIHPVWINDDGSESFYGWKKIIDNTKQLVLHTRIDFGEKILKIDVYPNRMQIVFYLYDMFNNETISNTLANTATLHKMAVFMEWAIKKDFYLGNSVQADIITKIKQDKANGVDFISEHNQCGHIYVEDFIPDVQQFVRQYCNNMSGKDILYSRDYVLSFLTNAKHRDNYMGQDAINVLSKVEYSPGNIAKIFTIIESRFIEYNTHGFAESLVELKI